MGRGTHEGSKAVLCPAMGADTISRHVTTACNLCHMHCHDSVAVAGRARRDPIVEQRVRVRMILLHWRIYLNPGLASLCTQRGPLRDWF